MQSAGTRLRTIIALSFVCLNRNPWSWAIMRQCRSRPWERLYFQLYSHAEFPQNVPVSVSVWSWTNFEFPRSSCSCVLPNSLYNLVQDAWLLSLTKTWVFIASFANVENLRQILMIWDRSSGFDNSFFVFTARTSFLVLVEARRFNPVFLFPRFCILSVFLSPHLRIFDWILTWVSPHQISQSQNDRLVLHRHFPDWLDCSNLVEGSSMHSTGCASPDSWVSTSPSPNSLALALPLVNLHWNSFLDLSLTWRSAFRSDQKENCWNGCKRTSRNEQTKKMVPLVTGEICFG